jgi:hypothetical protein
LAEKSSSSSNSNSKNGRKDPAELARTAVSTLAQLTGREPETVLGLRKQEDGWQILVEMVEMRRVPNSTDLLGCYAVTLDKDGEVVGYERRRRYQRGQTGGDDQ